MTLDALEKELAAAKGALPYVRGKSGAEISPCQSRAIGVCLDALPALLAVVKAFRKGHPGAWVDDDDCMHMCTCTVCKTLRELEGVKP